MRAGRLFGGVLALAIAAPMLVAAQQPPSPADLPAAYRGGELDRALKAHEWSRAESLLVAAVEREPHSPNAPALLALLGSVFLIERKPLNAAIAIKKAEGLAPIDDRTRFTLALAYVALHHGGWARPELERLARTDPSNMTYEYWLGRLDYDAGQYTSAVKRFERVAATDPTSVRAYDNLGLCYEALNRPDDALAPYRKAVDLNRTAAMKSAWPAVNLGILLRNRGDLREAEKLLREAVQYEESLAQAHYQLGVLLEQQDRLDEATTELKRATERDPEYAEPYYALARIYRRLGQPYDADQALASFEHLHDAKRSGSAQ